MKHPEKNTISDEEILSLFRQRKESAITETDRKYGALVFRIADNILHDPADSEECRNDAYLSLWNAIPPASPASLAAYLVRVTRNLALDRYRKNTRKKEIPPVLTCSAEELIGGIQAEEPLDDPLSSSELGALLNTFVKTLPKRQKYIFIERFYFSSSVCDIAAELSVSVPTVYRELDSIRAELKRYLERNGICL